MDGARTSYKGYFFSHEGWLIGLEGKFHVPGRGWTTEKYTI